MTSPFCSLDICCLQAANHLIQLHCAVAELCFNYMIRFTLFLSCSDINVCLLQYIGQCTDTVNVALSHDWLDLCWGPAHLWPHITALQCCSDTSVSVSAPLVAGRNSPRCCWGTAAEQSVSAGSPQAHLKTHTQKKLNILDDNILYVTTCNGFKY